MKRLLLTTVVLVALVLPAHATDLYRVWISSDSDAKDVDATGVTPLMRLTDGYLVLADEDAAAKLAGLPVESRAVVLDANLDQLAVDNRLDRANVDKYPLVFDEDGVRLYQFNWNEADLAAEFLEVRRLEPIPAPISYVERNPYGSVSLKATRSMALSLDSLIARISVDSLESYVEYLQSLFRRSGLSQNNVARDWLYNRFVAYGYDSVHLDPFVASIWGTPTNCYNVIATKVGASFPNHHVIIGAHRDAVPNSPGADDNGTGTAAVLEIARALADVETEMTIIFALFDAEEWGLYGSEHYADNAWARGDTVVYMLNMDMIGNLPNSNQANLFHGPLTEFTELWIGLADSLVGISGELAGNSAYSDHYPFQQYGWEVTFVHEYIFSNVYHSPRDSIEYVNMDYFHRMTQASGATAYYISEQAGWMSFDADQRVAWAPFTVSFTGGTQFDATSWVWSFGDGDSAFVQSPSHEYTVGGLYTVGMGITTTGGASRELVKPNYIIALADTLQGPDTLTGLAGTSVVVEVSARNNVPISYLELPVEYAG
ncbi:M20/M25/M40 family metallo-hydrolase, partial [candidate division GN15 bacterium]|nr:M20/M25/M40 family metallo-hydrolase [candidate division GN15 bacterium]